MYVHKKFQVIEVSHSRDIRPWKSVRKNENFGVVSEQPSQKPSGSIFFKAACAKILSIPPSTTYIKLTYIGRPRLSKVYIKSVVPYTKWLIYSSAIISTNTFSSERNSCIDLTWTIHLSCNVFLCDYSNKYISKWENS